MSDDTTRSAPPGIYEQYCEHPGCKEWGGFGFTVSKSAPMHWWCWEHYPYKEPGKTTASGSLSS